jgi:hypothetical protein
MRVPHTKFFTPFMRKCRMNFPSLPRPKTCFSHWLSLQPRHWMTLCAMFVEGPTWETIGLGEASDLDWLEPFNETAFSKHRKGIWLLKTSIIGNYCISLSKGQFSTLVRDLTCLGQKFYNDTTKEIQWWGAPKHTEPQPHPLANFSNLWKDWNNLTTNIEWWAPSVLYWIMGNKFIWCYLAAGLGLACWAQSHHHFSCFPSDKVKIWESSYMKKD